MGGFVLQNFRFFIYGIALFHPVHGAVRVSRFLSITDLVAAAPAHRMGLDVVAGIQSLVVCVGQQLHDGCSFFICPALGYPVFFENTRKTGAFATADRYIFRIMGVFYPPIGFDRTRHLSAVIPLLSTN